MDKTRLLGASRHKRPSTAQAALRIQSNGSTGASMIQWGAFSSLGGAGSLKSTPEPAQHQLLQLQESQKRCQELNADNTMLKQALSASTFQLKQSRPHTATIPRAAAKLSRSASAITPFTQTDGTEAHQSGLQGQVAGLKLQLISAKAQVQNLTEQLESESSSRKIAEQQKQHLWEAQLLQQQQSVTKDESHQQLLQQVQSHDAQQQKLVQKLQRLERQNAQMSQELCHSRERLQTLTQQCQKLQEKVQAGDDSRKQLLEKLDSTEQCSLQLEQTVLSRGAWHSQEQLQAQLQSLQTQLSTLQRSMLQKQAEMQHTEDSHAALQVQLQQQQQLHKQQQQQLQQQHLVEQHRQGQMCAEGEANNAQLMTDMAVLLKQSQEATKANELLNAKLTQVESESAKASTRAVDLAARNDAFILSEASLRLQLEQAIEKHELLVSEHHQELRQVQQRPEAADASAQANLSYAVHAVACQAGVQHSTAQALQAQLCSLQEEHAKSLKELVAAKVQSQGIHTQLAESQKQQWKLTACQQEAEAAWEIAEAAQEAAEAKLAAANNSIAQQLAAQHTRVDRLKAEVAQQAAHHKAQAEAQEAQLHSLRVQLAEHKQAVKQHPWASIATATATATDRLHLPRPGGGRPHTALPTGHSSSSSGKEWQQLKDRLGEVERLQSNVARDAAAMQAMGVLVEAKALKLDVHGSRPSSAGVSLTQTIRLQQQVRQLQMRLQEAQAKSGAGAN